MVMLVITRWFLCVSISSIAGQCWSWLGNSVQCLRKTCWSKPQVEASFWCTLLHSRPWLQSTHQQHEHLGLGELDDSRAVFWWLSMAKLFQDKWKIQYENFVGSAECFEFGNLFQLCHGNCEGRALKMPSMFSNSKRVAPDAACKRAKVQAFSGGLTSYEPKLWTNPRNVR